MRVRDYFDKGRAQENANKLIFVSNFLLHPLFLLFRVVVLSGFC